MYVFSFSGIMGSGKTLGQSIMAKQLQAKTNCTLYSNYGLKGSKPFTSFRDFLDVAVQPSSIVCLDEVHNDIDARDFNTNAVKYFSHIVFYLRKMRCTLFMTTPLFENVESRVRGVTNILIPVEKDKDNYYYPMYDWQGMKYLKTKKIAKEKAHEVASLIFDTHSMVVPLEYPANRNDFTDLLTEMKKANDQYFISQSAVRSVGADSFINLERKESELILL
jgi:hypothetical protein